ncbi:MAG: FAD/NAD(P)-binding protein [Proteobacteria bacterium]|nr:FAD/NAD(P)-binding protein [Pseudomonadota bacterium]MBU1546832.1 FAD/NAD(P)-binding protein [Pseudomonadota bacterium]MBU2618846.1 FAD/NAD(P)-binding protein [Pseudomonadota bacterium]
MPQPITDIYLPRQAKVEQIIVENSQISTFVLAFSDHTYNNAFRHQPGQFMMVSMPHCGEAPISISSTPTRPGAIHLSVRRAGKLTAAMHGLRTGDTIGLRGPYGRPFPMEQLQKKDLLFVAGGIGLAPLRGVINGCLDQRDQFGTLTVLYGSRTPSDIAFQSDLGLWKKQGVDCRLTVDAAEPGWDGAVGLVTSLLDDLKPNVNQSTTLVCGPPLMFRAVLGRLASMGFSDHQVLTTMERHMKCGVGICRHCHMDGKMACADGPVFSLAELRQLKIMELDG